MADEKRWQQTTLRCEQKLYAQFQKKLIDEGLGGKGMNAAIEGWIREYVEGERKLSDYAAVPLLASTETIRQRLKISISSLETITAELSALVNDQKIQPTGSKVSKQPEHLATKARKVLAPKRHDRGVA